MMIPSFISAIETPEEHDAVVRIFCEHYKRMVSVAHSVLHNMSDAEDTTMSVFESIAKTPSKYICENFNEQSALLYMVVKNRAIDLFRRKSVESKHTVEGVDPVTIEDSEAEIPVNIVINRETKTAMRTAMQELDEDYRTPLVLKYYYHFSNQDIGEALHLNYNTVNGRLFRAKRLLQEKLREWGYIE